MPSLRGVIMLYIFCLLISLSGVALVHSAPDAYKVLSIRRGASSNDIRKAYRKLAVQFHPDKNPGGEKKFLEITNAYEILSDPIKKRKYDVGGYEETPDSRAYYHQGGPRPPPDHSYQETEQQQHPQGNLLRDAVLGVLVMAILFGAQLALSSHLKRWLKSFENASSATPEELRRREEERLEREKRRTEKEAREALKKAEKAAEAARLAEEAEAEAAARREAEDREREEREASKRAKEAKKKAMKLERQRFRSICEGSFGGQDQLLSEGDAQRLAEHLDVEELQELCNLLTQSGITRVSQRRMVWSRLEAVVRQQEVQQHEQEAERSEADVALKSLGSNHLLRKKALEVREWDEEELRMLDKALLKFPQGVPRRWEQATAYIRTRTMEEVLLMVKSRQGLGAARFKQQEDFKAGQKKRAEVTSQADLRAQAFTDVQVNLVGAAAAVAEQSLRQNTNAPQVPSGGGGAAAPVVKSTAGRVLVQEGLQQKQPKQHEGTNFSDGSGISGVPIGIEAAVASVQEFPKSHGLKKFLGMTGAAAAVVPAAVPQVVTVVDRSKNLASSSSHHKEELSGRISMKQDDYLDHALTTGHDRLKDRHAVGQPPGSAAEDITCTASSGVAASVASATSPSATLGGGSGEWSGDQQAALVEALKKCGKELSDRWDRVADLVPGKTKAQCFKRFKEMREAFRARTKDDEEK
ncbi:hypothetical protein CEUSTIGMA_g1093.t1 [Chlamydomonas eustigma]|uniref:J domain-containing protein n=1 Tax=Chlamydomonas eustigma TaxID=1157962 RepID=A0A250WSJ8_9CHLO|nr:hypothetical protein CEUSTIGMA_g1093.t1 [Chlamydomonas eustigma]|eukprot:GAX73642.1 hypothetical protein CEUSTIGMA_g1093.t1 [Chlamydomonas eustigma]